MTCYNSAGIAIGSLGQYEGVRDVVENITAEDVSVIFTTIPSPYYKQANHLSHSYTEVAMALTSKRTWASGPIGLRRVAAAAMAMSAMSVRLSAQFIHGYWPYMLIYTLVFKNFHIENITASPVLIQQCTHWAGYNVPACADTPPTGFFSNISWSNFTGYMNEKVGTKAISWTCSPLATCEGFSFKDINVKSSTGANGTYSCTNVVGYNSACQKTN